MASFRLPLTVLGLLLSSCVAAQPTPTDNPIAARYGADAYPWAAALPWSQVVDVTAFAGATWDERLAAAQAAVVAAGGGVVYFPPGDYSFANDVFLADGVILRGATPSQPDAKLDGFAPPSRLLFPRYVPTFTGSGTPNSTAFRGIYNAGNATRTGLVNLDLNRATVSLYSSAYDSHSLVLFGLRSNNVARPATNVPTGGQHLWQRHTDRFVRNLQAFAFRQVLVANNRINDLHRTVDLRLAGWETVEVDDFQMPGYLVRTGSNWTTTRELTGTQAYFSYTEHYGISVRGTTGNLSEPPWLEPSRYYPGPHIRDNWVYATMRVKIRASGDGLVIRDNILLDNPNKNRWLSPNGDQVVQNAATLENRGIDWIGTNVLIENNQIEVHRHLLGAGPYLSVDGEGILIQEVHSTVIDGAIIRGNTVNAYIGIYKMPYSRNILIENNIVTGSNPGIWIDTDTNGAVFPMHNIVVRGNTVTNDILFVGSLRPQGVFPGELTNNRFRKATVSTDIVLSGNTRVDGTPHVEGDITLRAPTTTIPAPPALRLLAHRPLHDLRRGELVRLRAVVDNATPVNRVRIFEGRTVLGEFTGAPAEVVVAAQNGPTLFSAEARQPAVTVDRVVSGSTTQQQFTAYTAALATAGSASAEAGPRLAWALARFADEDRTAPGWWTARRADGLSPLARYALGEDNAPAVLRPERFTGAVAGRAETDWLELRLRVRLDPALRTLLESSADGGLTWQPVSLAWAGEVTPTAEENVVAVTLRHPLATAVASLLYRVRVEVAEPPADL